MQHLLCSPQEIKKNCQIHSCQNFCRSPDIFIYWRIFLQLMYQYFYMRSLSHATCTHGLNRCRLLFVGTLFFTSPRTKEGKRQTIVRVKSFSFSLQSSWGRCTVNSSSGKSIAAHLSGWSEGEIVPPRGRAIHHAHIVCNIQSHCHPNAHINTSICLDDGSAAATGHSWHLIMLYWCLSL